MIISSGMAYASEIEDAEETIRKEGNENIIVLHCNSSYPAQAEEVNLNIILFNTNNDVKSELKALDEVKKHRLKGVIMTPGFGDTKLEDVFIDIINKTTIKEY